MSAIPVWVIGFIIGFIGAIMGIGGGFLLVPMLIYLLRVPTATVIGTSMVLTLVTMASATVMHAATNHLVDAVLALILMVGGVIGAQFGARTGQKMRGERLRLLLGLLVFAVGLRFAYELVLAARTISIRCGHWRARMMRRIALSISPSSLTHAARRVRLRRSGWSCRSPTIAYAVTSSFIGEELVLFGGIEPDPITVTRAAPPYDIVVTVAGPRADLRTGRKERVLGIWVNAEFARIRQRAVLSRRAEQPAGDAIANRGTAAAAADRARQFPPAAAHRYRPRRHGARRPVPPRLRAAADTAGPYREVATAVTFLTPTVFRTAIGIAARNTVGVRKVTAVDDLRTGPAVSAVELKPGERIVTHRIGKVGSYPLWQEKIVEPDLQAAQSVRVGDGVDGPIARTEEGWHASEFARIHVDPNTDHALLAPRAQGLARARHRDDEIIRRTQRSRDGSGSIVPNNTSSSPTKLEVTATRWLDSDTTSRSAIAGPAPLSSVTTASVSAIRRIIRSSRNEARKGRRALPPARMRTGSPPRKPGGREAGAGVRPASSAQCVRRIVHR